MTSTAEKILKDALDLTPVDRAALIERLFLSFDKSTDKSIDAAWAKEIESRFNAYDSGNIPASPANEVFKRINKI